MNDYWYCLASKIISCIGFVTLVIFDHQLIGLLCLLLVATMGQKDK